MGVTRNGLAARDPAPVIQTRKCLVGMCLWSTSKQPVCYVCVEGRLTYQTMLDAFSDSKLASYSRSEPYSRQEHICRSGQRVLSVRRTKRNITGPYQDFFFSVACGSSGSIYPCVSCLSTRYGSPPTQAAICLVLPVDETVSFGGK